METFVKKFFDCFEEDLLKIIYDAEQRLYNDNICVIECEERLKRIEDEKLSDSEYRIKHGWSTREKDIKCNKEIIENCKERIVKNENKISFYHNMKKILSIL